MHEKISKIMIAGYREYATTATMADAILTAISEGCEPVYQLRTCEGEWADVEQPMYERNCATRRRAEAGRGRQVSRELESIGEAITAALEVCPASEVLSIVTGAFVGLTVELVRRQGHPLDKPITINGCGNRNITIHPVEPEVGDKP